MYPAGRGLRLPVGRAGADRTGRRAGDGYDAGLANASSDDIQFKLALLHLYKEATDVTLVLPYTTVNLTQTAVTRAFIGSEEGEIAIREMNRARRPHAQFGLRYDDRHHR